MRTNYVGRDVPTAGGVIAVAGFAVTLGVVTLVDVSTARVALPAAVAVFGFGVIGLLDDIVGTHSARGFRGHLAAARHGELTSGTAKLLVGLAVALATASLLGGDAWDRFLAAVAIAGCANAANLLDLAPALPSRWRSLRSWSYSSPTGVTSLRRRARCGSWPRSSD